MDVLVLRKKPMIDEWCFAWDSSPSISVYHTHMWPTLSDPCCHNNLRTSLRFVEHCKRVLILGAAL